MKHGLSKLQDELTEIAFEALTKKRDELRAEGYIMPVDLAGEGIPLDMGAIDHDWYSGRYRFAVNHAMEPHYLGYPLLECEGDVETMTVYNMVVHWEHFKKKDEADE